MRRIVVKPVRKRQEYTYIARGTVIICNYTRIYHQFKYYLGEDPEENVEESLNTPMMFPSWVLAP
jgi:hypothetical protein